MNHKMSRELAVGMHVQKQALLQDPFLTNSSNYGWILHLSNDLVVHNRALAAWR